MSNALRVLAVVSVVAASLISGCSSGKPKPISPRKYDIEITLDPSLVNRAVTVDLVGVNAASYGRWENYSMTSYWRDGDPMRRDAEKDRVTFNFQGNASLTNTLKSTNAIWGQWMSRGATHVFVLAEKPGPPDDRPGNQNARRQILALDKRAWAKSPKTLKVLVKQSGIDVLTPAMNK